MKRIAELIPFAAVIAGGFVAQRALGADGHAVANGAAGVAGVLDSLSQYPLFLGFVSWLSTELGTRLWPTHNKTSTFYVLRELAHAGAVVFTALERVCDYLYQHPFAQKQRPPAEAPAAAPASPPAADPPPPEQPQ
jgi:hypothetical protein